MIKDCLVPSRPGGNVVAWFLARAELSTAIALYRAMEMTFYLLQAEAALEQVGGQKC